MPAKLPRDDFVILVRRAGLELTPAEIDDLYGAWELLEPMTERVRAGVRPREAEPALIFRPESV